VTGPSTGGPGLRPFLPDDAPLLAEIFRSAIEELTGEDYGQAQQEAWAATVDDEAAFGKRLASMLTLVATLGGRPVGFAALKGADEIEMLYVDPATGRRGVATLLVDALEKLAGARGAGKLKVVASDNAEPFFAARRYVPQQRMTRMLGDQWLGATLMDKALPASTSPRTGGRA
jgi:putative acetyltransferase